MPYRPPDEYAKTTRTIRDIGTTTFDVGASPDKGVLDERRVKKLARWRKAVGALVILVLVSASIIYIMNPKIKVRKAEENFAEDVDHVDEPVNAMELNRLENQIGAVSHEKQRLNEDNKLLANMVYETQKQLYMLAKERAELEKTLVGQRIKNQTGTKVSLDFSQSVEVTTKQSETKQQQAVPATSEPKTTGPRTRLARLALPLYYTLTLKVHLPTYDVDVSSDALKMEGVLLLKFVVTEPTYFIEMHSKNLYIDEVHLQIVKLEAKKYGQGYDKQRNLSAKYVESEKLSLSDGKLIEKGLYLIMIRYNGKVETENELGLYATKLTSAGKEYMFASTHFESSSARKMVPCFDEPEYKAIWKVTVVHPKGSTAISNTPEIGAKTSTNNDDWIVTNFEQTPKMSSYLLAIAVGKMAYIEGTTANGNVAVRLYGTQEVVDKMSIVLNYTIKALDYFEKRFQIPYALKKLDVFLVSKIPGAGMENYGLIIAGIEDVDAKKIGAIYVANLVAHEVAHQWFGNLVNMKWWNEIWLKEGLVSSLTIDAVPHLDSALDTDESYMKTQQRAFERIKPITPSLVYEADRSDSHDDVFREAIFYQKGAMITAMFRDVIGDEAFELALKAYLNKFSYGSTISTDFLNELQNAYKKLNPDGIVDIYRIGIDFITQKHHPVLTVTENDSSGSAYKVQQMGMENGSASELWQVPLFVSTKNTDGTLGSQLQVLSKGESILVHFDRDIPPIVNHDAKGLFRVCYSENVLKKIVTYLMEKTETLSLKTRARVIYDAAFCDPRNMKHIGHFLKVEEGHFMRAAILRGLTSYKAIDTEKYTEYFQSKTRELFDKLIDEVLTGKYPLLPEGSPLSDVLLWFITIEEEYFNNRAVSIVEKIFIEPCLERQECQKSKSWETVITTYLVCVYLEQPSNDRLLKYLQMRSNSQTTQMSVEFWQAMFGCQQFFHNDIKKRIEESRTIL